MGLTELRITDTGAIGEHNKVRQAVDLIREYEHLAVELNPLGYCVCSSGGKDSQVLVKLFIMAGVKFYVLHNITGIDPPELVYFRREVDIELRQNGVLVNDEMPEMSFFALMLYNLTPPMRNIRYCCPALKEHGGEGSLCSTGVRWEESTGRKLNRNSLEIVGKTKAQKTLFSDNDESRRAFENCQKLGKKIINPIVSWHAGDIWDFSKEFCIRQSSLYEEGFDRLGCIGCPQARKCGRERDFLRWPKFKRLYLYYFEKILRIKEQRGLKCHFSTAQQWFDWWLSDKAQEQPIDGQMELDYY